MTSISDGSTTSWLFARPAISQVDAAKGDRPLLERLAHHPPRGPNQLRLRVRGAGFARDLQRYINAYL